MSVEWIEANENHPGSGHADRSGASGPVKPIASPRKRAVTYRLDYTIRLLGRDDKGCQFCEGLANVNKNLAAMEKMGAWGFSIHLVQEADQRAEDEQVFQQEIRLR